MNRQDSIVVDPLLCYVNSHRNNLPDQDLRFLIKNHFASEDISSAYQRLNQQTAPFLDAIHDDREDLSSQNLDSVEAILRIFRLCDRYRITLPEFAVTDLKTLPPPPNNKTHKPVDLESPILRDSAADISTVAHSANNSSSNEPTSNGFAPSEKASSDALFTRRMLLKIVKELKQLKSLVIDLTVKNESQETEDAGMDEESAAFDESKQEDCDQSPRRANEDEEEEEKAMLEDDCPPSNTSVQPANSPAPNGDDHKPPSRDSSASISRTALTPPRKRGSSRSSGSIEDTVAKLKARRQENPLSLIFNSAGQNANVDSVDSCSPSPKTGLDESEATPSDEKSPEMTPVYCGPGHVVKNECESLFPAIEAARGLAAVMMQPGLFLHSGVSRLDLVNSAAAMLASGGVFPMAPGGMLAAALSPRNPHRGLPPFPTTAPQQQTVSMESCFAAPTSNTPCVSPMIRQQQKEPPVIRSARPTIPRSQHIDAAPKLKKAPKRQELASPTMSDPDDTRKRQSEQSDGDNSLAESSSGIHGNGNGKPFICTHDNCDKRFTNKFLLKKHEFIHTGLRPHQCPYCLKKFNRKDNLLRHKVTHEKNYTTPRRRTCRVFGVKGSMVNSSIRQSDLVTASAGSSPSAESKVCLQQRSSSCAPSENETANRQSTPFVAQVVPPTPATVQAPLHSAASTPNTADFSLAALASYTALAQSLWPRAAMNGVHSMNN